MTRRIYRTSTRRSAALFTTLLTIAWMFVAALPASAQVITVSLEPAEATNAVGTDHTVTATVTEDAAALEGAVVLFEVSAEGTATPDTGSATTDAAGEAEFTFTNNAEVTNTITACVDEDENEACDEGEATDTADKTWVVPVATTIELAPAEETNPVDSTHTVTATVKDQLEPPQPFAGAAVHFDVSGDPTPDPDSGDAVTDAAGDADFAFTNDTEGTNTITACIDENENEACDEGEPFDTATKIWDEPVPTTIELTPEMGLNQPGEDHTVVAKVTDQFDAPVAGVSVEINVDEDGSPNPTALTQNTDANGEVEFTFTNSEVSANTITACIAGTETCDTAEKLWQDPVPTTIELAPATGTNPTDTSHTVTATVLDQFEEPFEAVDVHFDVTGDGTPTPAAGDDATDVAGEAEFAFTNDTAGTNTITACIDLDESGTCGMEPSDTATKVWVEVTDTITLAPLTGTNEPGTAHVVTATVLNASAAPVEGAAVHVSVSGGGTPTPAAGNLTTDAAGEADFVFTNDTDVTNTITACLDVDDSGTCDEGEPTATATKVWQGVPPECPGFEGDPRNDVIGTGASDTLIGTGAADIICGKGGADEINGKGGRDLLLGGGGNDDIFGKKGNDRLKGGKGKDLLNGGKGTDVCKGGPGKDTIRKCEN